MYLLSKKKLFFFNLSFIYLQPKIFVMSKKIVSILFLIFSLANVFAQINIGTFHSSMSIDTEGFVTSIAVNGRQILHQGHYPLLIGCSNRQLTTPTKIEANAKTDSIFCIMSDNQIITIKLINIHPSSANDVFRLIMEIVDAPDNYDALILMPVALTIHEQVGDIIGVVQGGDVAFGIQALNIKTNAGIPQEYAEAVAKYLNYNGKPTEISVATIPPYRLAATDIGDGAQMQFSCRNRSRIEYRTVQQLDSALVLPVSGEDASLKGAKIAIFGCARAEALKVIGQLELDQHLPHPMINGEWAKTARQATCSYLISDYSEKDFDFVLDKCTRGGFQYLYHIEPFATWGHFTWDTAFVKGGDNEVKQLVDKAARHGIKLGVHTLSNFITTNDRFVTPIPSPHLLKQGTLSLLANINEKQTDLAIRKSPLFDKPMSINTLQIGNELITYKTIDTIGDQIILRNCQRGAFGTAPTAHIKTEPLYKLWDYPYKTLFPDLTLQDSMADRLVEIFNKTGLAQISFDGLEGCTYTGHDDYATARFVTRCWEGWNHPVINDGSNLNHYTWHINTRMNWGEPWGEAIRTAQVNNRIKNQDFFNRNLFPKMLGWFLIRLSDKKFPCTSIEDLEWAMSEASGFDAGFAMTIYMKTLRRHGQIDTLLEALHNWETLRMADAFTDEQKLRLKDPLTEWHLEKVGNQNFNLYPLFLSKEYHCDLSEMQPGQTGGADWQWDTPYQSSVKITVKIDGDGSISNPTFTTPNGTIQFPCTLKSGQLLNYYFDGSATITDLNYNIITTVTPQGRASLAKGQSVVSFSCDYDKNADAPTVNVRYITKGTPEKVYLSK